MRVWLRSRTRSESGTLQVGMSCGSVRDTSKSCTRRDVYQQFRRALNDESLKGENAIKDMTVFLVSADHDAWHPQNMVGPPGVGAQILAEINVALRDALERDRGCRCLHEQRRSQDSSGPAARQTFPSESTQVLSLKVFC